MTLVRLQLTNFEEILADALNFGIKARPQHRELRSPLFA